MYQLDILEFYLLFSQFDFVIFSLRTFFLFQYHLGIKAHESWQMSVKKRALKELIQKNMKNGKKSTLVSIYIRRDTKKSRSVLK